ncbi:MULTISPECIES: hypothetical protein [Microbacterium]|uniref:hypothetical protein n=1 Tax=Microbacterium TaxID=33882 RepID=UPI00344CAF73
MAASKNELLTRKQRRRMKEDLKNEILRELAEAENRENATYPRLSRGGVLITTATAALGVVLSLLLPRESDPSGLVVVGAVLAGFGALLSAATHNRNRDSDLIADHMGKLAIVLGLASAITVALLEATPEVQTLAGWAGGIAAAVAGVVIVVRLCSVHFKR